MKFIRLLCTVLLASALFPATGFSQDAPPSRYLRLEYMKSEPGKAAEYLRLIRGYWIPIQQARVAAGRIASWKFYSVSYPNGAGAAVVISTTKPDKYDRYLADVFVGAAGKSRAESSELRAGRANEDMFLNNALLENGHAERKDAWEFGDWGAR